MKDDMEWKPTDAERLLLCATLKRQFPGVCEALRIVNEKKKLK